MRETVTIGFSGLMVFHQDNRNKRMEIGILPQKTHVPRILTMVGENVVDVFYLDTNPSQRNWRLEVTNPVRTGILIYQSGSKEFHRLTHEDDRDFRWGMDLEGDDFYDKDLTKIMLTKKLRPVLQVAHGEFYTGVKSEPLNRRKDNGQPERFGRVAGITSCDIVIDGGSVSLKVGDTDIFWFKTAGAPLPENTSFQIANTPPDERLSTDDLGMHDKAHKDHFQFYYELFEPKNIPKPRFSFERSKDPVKGPDPRLCGKVQVGLRKEPL